jgi:hypothetical protein
MWFDDIESLKPKYDFARRTGLKGVGPYRFDQLQQQPKEGSSSGGNRKPLINIVKRRWAMAESMVRNS